jgi:repressor LexA
MNEFGRLLRDLREKNKETQLKLSKILGITPQMVSKLEMGKNKPSMEILKKLSEHFKVSTQYLLGLENRGNRKSTTDMLPVIGEIAAGEPVFARENIIGYLPVFPDISGDFYLLVKGKSMEPLILDGARVLIEKKPLLKRGDVGAFLINGGEAVIKRYFPDTFGVVLRSENPGFAPLFFNRRQWDEECKILGKAVRIVIDIK